MLLRGTRRKHRFAVSPLVQVRILLPSSGSCLQSHYLATGIHATAVCSDTLNQCCSLRVRDQVPFLYKETDKCILIFICCLFNDDVGDSDYMACDWIVVNNVLVRMSKEVAMA
jgi:hypothetical protein